MKGGDLGRNGSRDARTQGDAARKRDEGWKEGGKEGGEREVRRHREGKGGCRCRKEEAYITTCLPLN